MTLIDVLGHIGYVFFAVGIYLVAKGKRWGFLVQAGGDVIWSILGFKMGMTSIALWDLGFFVLSILGYIQLGRHPEWTMVLNGIYGKRSISIKTSGTTASAIVFDRSGKELEEIKRVIFDFDAETGQPYAEIEVEGKDTMTWVPIELSSVELHTDIEED